MSLNPLLKITDTLSAPILKADLAQSRAVSPIPKTITCPFNLKSFSLLFDILTFSQTLGRKVFELKTLGRRYASLPNYALGEVNPAPTKIN